LRRKGPLSILERWIVDNYSGRNSNIPLVYDRKREIYLRIGELVYGPILWKHIPSEIKNHTIYNIKERKFYE
jgi:hypothetical protein